MNLKIGTRGSKLALTQTNFVADKIKKLIPEADIEICVIKTSGDIRVQSGIVHPQWCKNPFLHKIAKRLAADSFNECSQQAIVQISVFKGRTGGAVGLKIF